MKTSLHKTVMEAARPKALRIHARPAGRWTAGARKRPIIASAAHAVNKTIPIIDMAQEITIYRTSRAASECGIDCIHEHSSIWSH
ncbi:hypothetical protein [Diaphorobacter ruginosibacter]|uniref:hypothetical protein n=1 Tax=Diaphorobacter ruginosibacter TaxID=1715720 RepID=UPI00334074F8